MVSQDSGCFVCSRWFVVIVGFLYILVGGLFLLGAAGIAAGVKPENDSDTKYSAVTILITGISLIALGVLGVYSSYSMHYCSMMVFAIIVSISLVLSVLGGLVIVGNGGWAFVGPGAGLLLSIPTVICSWVVVSGLHSSG